MTSLNRPSTLAARPWAGPIPAKSEPLSGGWPRLALLMRLLRAALLVLTAFGAQAGVVLTTLHSYGTFTNGSSPLAGLVQGSDGNFYGTTAFGGGAIHNAGTVFKITTNGAVTCLHTFTGGDGANPEAGLVQGSDGYLYGTTTSGGPYGSTTYGGTVFKISTNGVFANLYSFPGNLGNGGDGTPVAGLVQASDGYLYGTTLGGPSLEGRTSQGTVFKISTNGMLTNLYSFTGGSDGANPSAALVQGSDGYLYGTTAGGGATSGGGSVFKISTNGAYTTLYSFTGTADGLNPFAPLVQGSDGYFYGTTTAGGRNNYGTVFRISAHGALIRLYSFSGAEDGANSEGGLVQGSDGDFYGTTSGGGASSNGTVFKISTNGTLTTLYSFTGTNDGAIPQAGLALGGDGYFYGTTAYGGDTFGSFGNGTVFRITAAGALATLYSFTVGDDGAGPNGLVQGGDGYLYGTTIGGGGTNGDGTIFKVSANGACSTLYSFSGGDDGAVPNGVVLGSDGYLYGTTQKGEATNNLLGGTVFKITTNGELTHLYSFSGGNDGGYPQGGLALGNDGYLYGTATYGGAYGNDTDDYVGGTVFKISTNGALARLYSFSGGDGLSPSAGLVQGSDGAFYGTTYGGGDSAFSGDGTVFRIRTNGILVTLHSFTGQDGKYPQAPLTQGSDGAFYGTTSEGGAASSNQFSQGFGTVFKITASGALTRLYSFTGGNDGEGPQAGLVEGNDGYFYGVAGGGGTNNAGTVFRISANGTLTSLYSFTGGADGANPSALLQGAYGNFYGTTSGGGLGGIGTIFRLTIIPPAAPAFQSLTLTNSMLSLTWSAEAGGTYQLQYSSDLTSTNWINLDSAMTASGATLSATNLPTTGSQRFYRLVLTQ